MGERGEESKYSTIASHVKSDNYNEKLNGMKIPASQSENQHALLLLRGNQRLQRHTTKPCICTTHTRSRSLQCPHTLTPNVDFDTPSLLSLLLDFPDGAATIDALHLPCASPSAFLLIVA